MKQYQTVQYEAILLYSMKQSSIIYMKQNNTIHNHLTRYSTIRYYIGLQYEAIR